MFNTAVNRIRLFNFTGIIMKHFVFTLILLLATVTNSAAKDIKIGFFVGDSDVYNCMQAVQKLDLDNITTGIFSKDDISRPETALFIKDMDLAVVDIMPRQPAEWLLASIGSVNPEAKIFAVRTSSHTEDFTDAGFIINESLREYYQYTTSENLKNLILFMANTFFDIDVKYQKPVLPPENALYHPDAPVFFKTMEEYTSWYKESGHYNEGQLWDIVIAFPNSSIDSKKKPLDALVRAYEKKNINTAAWLRSADNWEAGLKELLSSEELTGRLGSIGGTGLKFSKMLSPELNELLKKADVPVFNHQKLFFTKGDEWEKSEQGISTTGISFQFSVPELAGLIEPGVIGVKIPVESGRENSNIIQYEAVEENIERQAERALKWHRLKTVPNRDKKIVLMYYNHGGGKQNIGASYLNVFKSIEQILTRMADEGYTVKNGIDEEEIKDLLMKSGRNIGSWAPGELDNLLTSGSVIKIPVNEYKNWLSKVHPDYAQKVKDQWGTPEDSTIMVKDNNFIVPCVNLGNIILVPQPSRGWVDDPEKLYHSNTLYPHHQYTAFYLWLQNSFKPDAMISLGTHGTHEWLPGKQSGLSMSCPPEVLLGDIPNLYPYIVDDVGEGIQAKRRGRGVVISHAVPPFKKGGLYEEYSKLTALISEYEASPSPTIKETKLERIKEMVSEAGIDKDLGINEFEKESLEKVEHYLLELKNKLIPYGLHTFGVSAEGEGLEETAAAIAGDKKELVDNYRKKIKQCGPSETDALIRGLRGGYIEAGSGNDPVRNPESLPTGRNFYAFDPDKVPSREAWERGKKAAQDIITQYMNKHEGKYPEKVGIVLWSVETIRDEGINAATALYLMGMTPVWDNRDKIDKIVPIPGSTLNRPRIDVLLQMSGLFRDTFPAVALMLDKAVNEASALNDVENFISRNTGRMYKALIEKGYSKEDAQKISKIRLYSAAPGSYGTKVSDFTGASGSWEDDKVVAENGFIDVVSYGYSSDTWGKPMKNSYKENLKDVKATVKTSSSNLYGTMDNDDVFQYLGGLTMAVKQESGQAPEVFMSVQSAGDAGRIETLAETVGKEMRSRYLNPEWIKGMKNEKYAGAREMADFMENMWGWQVTVPDSIDTRKWEMTYETYVEDKHNLDIKEFFNKENPWAYQSMTARMLEAVRKDYWKANEKVSQKLAVEYAVNVVEKGVACCDHTCNNPLLNQMVVNIISLPGVLSPEIVEKFKLAVEKAAAKKLEDQVTERKEIIEKLSKTPENRKQDSGRQNPDKMQKQQNVEGYKMEDMDTQDESTELTSSGMQWAASLFVLLIIALFFWGSKRKRH